MPFHTNVPKPAAITVGSTVYICDEMKPTEIQYKAKVITVQDGNCELMLYPAADIEPLWGSVGPEYNIPSIPLTLLSVIPFVGPHLRGYQEELRTAGFPSPGYTAADGRLFNELGQAAPTIVAPPSAPPATGMAADLDPNAKVPERTPNTAFSFSKPATPIQAVAQQTQRVLAETALLKPPACDYQPEVGMTVTVKSGQNNAHWDALAGHSGTIVAISQGEEQPLIDVEIEGIQHEGIAAGRFSVSTSQPAQNQPVAAPAAPAAPAVAPRLNKYGVDINEAIKLRGVLVSILIEGTESCYNCILDTADENGISFLNSQRNRPWDEVRAISALSYNNIPGAPPPKQPRVKAVKADKPEGEQGQGPSQPSNNLASTPAPVSETQTSPSAPPSTASSAASSAGSASGSTTSSATIEPHLALGEAVALVGTILGGSKVTRKMVEGLLPLLQLALEHQKATAANAAAGVHQMDIFPAPSPAPLAALFSTSDVVNKIKQMQASVAGCDHTIRQTMANMVEELNKLQTIVSSALSE